MQGITFVYLKVMRIIEFFAACMSRFILILLSIILIASCNGNQSKSSQELQTDYPDSSTFNNLPKQIHVVGIVQEVSYGYCGIFCQGGYIKVDLETDISDFDYKSVYLITACLSMSTKSGNKVDVTATLHTGLEEECYYKSFDRPANKTNIIFYQLSETETRKVL
jgi:hypothetical protein